METQSNKTNSNSFGYVMEALPASTIEHMINSFSKEDILTDLNKIFDVQNFSQHSHLVKLFDFLYRALLLTGKRNFLVFDNNKYINVPTENIAFFYIKYESPVIMRFDKQEYFVSYSLDRIQDLLPEKQFFRINRRYLINFSAVKDVEHYFARKLLVNSVIPLKEKLIVSKEKVSEFLRWLDNR
jgi:two-component system, LytTR family, response regulator LytT